jgi:hypothetical protein
MLNYMKDYFERGMMQVKSMELLEEMKGIVRENGFLGGTWPGQGSTRVIASALAAVAFAEQATPRLMLRRFLGNVRRDAGRLTPEQIAVGRNVSDYLKRIGLYGQ